MDTFGKRLKKARIKRGVTVQELGAKIDYSPSTISNVENGKD